MKKLLAILLSLLLLTPALALAEEPAPAESVETEATLTGEWFAEVQGMIVRITLNEDGSYAVAVPALSEEAVTGTWAEKDGFLYFDGNELPEINVLGADVMKWIDYDAFLRREAPLPMYTPAEPVADVPLEYYAGHWESLYVGVNGAMLFSDTLGAKTAALIDGTTVALIGPLTGETVLETVYENGALTWTEKDVGITFALQQDGFLRMTVQSDTDVITLYLLPQYVEGVSPAPEP